MHGLGNQYKSLKPAQRYSQRQGPQIQIYEVRSQRMIRNLVNPNESPASVFPTTCGYGSSLLVAMSVSLSSCYFWKVLDIRRFQEHHLPPLLFSDFRCEHSRKKNNGSHYHFCWEEAGRKWMFAFTSSSTWGKHISPSVGFDERKVFHISCLGRWFSMWT